MTWQHAAACAGEDTDLFFPIGTSGLAARQADVAKQICGRCPVSTACLQWAISSGTEHGVWGGLTEEERRAWKRRHLRGRSEARMTLLHDLLAPHQETAVTPARRRAATASP